jgi:glycine/D-amino acid oxidase-like deaminating enzyme
MRPFGRLSRDHDHLYIATDFNGWGMTNGVIAGMILSDRITGKHNK